VLAWVPDAEVVHMVTGVDGVVADVYDGVVRPPGVAEVEFYAPPFPATADALKVIAEMPRLRVVQLQLAGVDAYRPLVPPGVALCNARGVHDAGTAEWAVGAILAAQRDFPAFARAQVEGTWDWHYTRALAGSTVLIVGFGAIGSAVERRLAGFEVEVVGVARTAREGVHGMDELPRLLPRANVVVVIVPYTTETHDMVDAAFLAAMADDALLVNAARGAVVNTDALVAELRRGRLRAALDVTDPEPLPAGHPLWELAFITPHVAGSTPVSRRRARYLIRDQIVRHVTGQPLTNVIDRNY
jgi:phosphoglycerate dehydrogenase-like enzyme